MGPPEEKMETMQVFNARIATQVAQACHVMYVDDGRFICTPDRVRCREALGDQTSK
jgi:endonuclease III